MASNSEVTGIEKLSSSNYGCWVDDIRVVLMDRNCWQIVSGNEVAPEDNALNAKIVRDFKMRKDRAYSTIYLNISKEYRPLIVDTQEPTEAWSRLKLHFQPDSRARVIGLYDDFFNCKIGPEEEVGLYAARLKKISDELADAAKPVPEWFKSFQLIRFLPQDFNSIVQTIYRWTDVEFTTDKILKELLAEESRLNLSRKDHDATAFHLSRNRQHHQGPRSSTSHVDELIRPSARPTTRPKRRSYHNNRGKPRQRTPSTKRRGKPEASLIVEALVSEQDMDTEWIFDTAASHHFCSNRHLLRDFQPMHNASMKVAIGGVSCPVEGKGNVKLEFRSRGESNFVNLRDVLYSPKLRQNLISGALIDNNGVYFVGQNNKITVHNKNGHKIFEAHKRAQRGLYFVQPFCNNVTSNIKVDDKKVKQKVSFSTSSINSLELWHKRYGHINTQYIAQTSSNNSVRGLPNLKNQTLNCEPCKLSKTRRKSFKPLGRVRSKKPLELLHMDLCGPLPDVAVGGFRYFLTITDDYSRKVTTYALKEKREVFKFFTSYQKRVERFLNCKILNVRTDNGLEFCSKEFEDFLEDQGIKMERTNTYTPEQNGVSERFNYTAVNAIKALLKDSGLKNGFWVEALFCFTYAWNRICHGKDDQTPFEKFGGNKPSVKHLKTFGTAVYLGVPKQQRKKLDMRAKKGIMVGYAQRTKGYRIWLPLERKIVESINVTFEDELASSGAVLEPSNSEQLKETTFNFDPESDSDTEIDDNIDSDDYSSESEPEGTSSGKSECNSPIPINKPNWIRKTVPRPDGSRTDIYYNLEGSNTRLRSHNDVEKFCDKNNIPFERSDFIFSSKNASTDKTKPVETNIINA